MKQLKANRYASYRREKSSKIVHIELLQHSWHYFDTYKENSIALAFYSSYQIRSRANYTLDWLGYGFAMESGRKSGEPFLITKGLHYQWNNIKRNFLSGSESPIPFSAIRSTAGLSILPFSANSSVSGHLMWWKWGHFHFTCSKWGNFEPFCHWEWIIRISGAMAYMWHCSIELDIEQTFGISNWFYWHEVQGNIDIWNIWINKPNVTF